MYKNNNGRRKLGKNSNKKIQIPSVEKVKKSL